jgi:hypothetical protein
MKPAIQSWPIVPDSWQTAVPCVLNNHGKLVVGNIEQDKLFHYVEKHFVNKKILSKLEELNNAKA